MDPVIARSVSANNDQPYPLHAVVAILPFFGERQTNLSLKFSMF